jgi:hypothetical protein
VTVGDGELARAASHQRPGHGFRASSGTEDYGTKPSKAFAIYLRLVASSRGSKKPWPYRALALEFLQRAQESDRVCVVADEAPLAHHDGIHGTHLTR